jgi:xanthine dehydrogenase accessory factor
VRTQSYDVLSALAATLEEGRPAYLITVLETWGASPRPAGSVLCFDPELNKTYGSVSGGCVEMDLLSDLRSRSDSAQFPKIEQYGAHNKVDLPCGATLRLLVEYLEPDATSKVFDQSLTNLALFERLLLKLDLGEACRRRIDLKSGLAELLLGANISGSATPPIATCEQSVTQFFKAPLRMLVLGAGDLADVLIPLARQIGYRVTLCEPRSEILERRAHIETDELVKDMLPDDLVAQKFLSEEAAVVAVSHDPRVDDLALMAALQGNAHFVGAMGSERTSQARRERLYSLGLSDTQVSRLRAPIGLDIGSRTPIEIAIAIVAQLVQIRSYESGKALNEQIRKYSETIG